MAFGRRWPPGFTATVGGGSSFHVTPRDVRFSNSSPAEGSDEAVNPPLGHAGRRIRSSPHQPL